MPIHMKKFIDPRQWTILTWAAVALWLLCAVLGNFPPSSSPEFLDPVVTEKVTEMGVLIGWPLVWYERYWTGRGQLVRTSWNFAKLLANAVAICVTLSALIYFLQAYAIKLSIRAMLGATAVVAMLLALIRYMAVNDHAMACYYVITCVYFCPPIVVILLRARRRRSRQSAATEQTDEREQR